MLVNAIFIVCCAPKKHELGVLVKGILPAETKVEAAEYCGKGLAISLIPLFPDGLLQPAVVGHLV